MLGRVEERLTKYKVIRREGIPISCFMSLISSPSASGACNLDFIDHTKHSTI